MNELDKKSTEYRISELSKEQRYDGIRYYLKTSIDTQQYNVLDYIFDNNIIDINSECIETITVFSATFSATPMSYVFDRYKHNISKLIEVVLYLVKKGASIDIPNFGNYTIHDIKVYSLIDYLCIVYIQFNIIREKDSLMLKTLEEIFTVCIGNEWQQYMDNIVIRDKISKI